MIQGTPCAALFWYVHRPMSRGHDSMDGGFIFFIYYMSLFMSLFFFFLFLLFLRC